MELEGSLLRLEKPAAFHYPEADQSSPLFPSCFLKIHFNITLPFTPECSRISQFL
jgi:hypothetical protein